MLPEDEYLDLRAADAFLVGTIAAIGNDTVHFANLPSAIAVIARLVKPATDRKCFRLAHERLVGLLDQYGDIPDKEIDRGQAWLIADELGQALKDFRSLEL